MYACMHVYMGSFKPKVQNEDSGFLLYVCMYVCICI
jgi:hypothetical protein